MRSTFKVLFYVKKGSEKPNGNLPLMCRLTVDGEIKQFSCKMDVPLRLWDVKNNRASGKSVEAQKINIAVDKIRVEVNRRYQELMQTDGYVTAAKLKDGSKLPVSKQYLTFTHSFQCSPFHYSLLIVFQQEHLLRILYPRSLSTRLCDDLYHLGLAQISY